MKLSNAEFEVIGKAEDTLINQLTIEERYDLHISNFLELQRSIHTVASEYSVRLMTEESDFDKASATVSRAFLNFLSSARGYIDQVLASSAKHLVPEVKLALNAEYDAKMSYRGMEALRNYAQHCGLPITGFTIGAQWSGRMPAPEARLIQSANPMFDPRRLARPSNFKQTVYAELTTDPKSEYDLFEWAKEYVESLSSIQMRIRRLQRSEFDEAKGLLNHEVLRYTKLDDRPETTGVFAIAKHSNGHPQREVYLGPRLEHAIDVLKKMNPPLANFQRRQILT